MVGATEASHRSTLLVFQAAAQLAAAAMRLNERPAPPGPSAEQIFHSLQLAILFRKKIKTRNQAGHLRAHLILNHFTLNQENQEKEKLEKRKA